MLARISPAISPDPRLLAATPTLTPRDGASVSLDRFDPGAAHVQAPAPSAPRQALPPQVQQLFAGMTDALFNRTGRIWPGYDWRPYQVMVVNLPANEAYLWNAGGAQPGQPPQVVAIPADQLPNEWRTDFNMGEWNGIDTLGVALKAADPARNPYGHTELFAAHEGFHYFGQREFGQVSMPFEARFPPLPAPAEPRYYRQKIADSLLAALRAPDADARQKAKAAAVYWNDKFKAEYPDEASASRGLDIIEGTARYAEYFSAAAFKLGADRSDAELVSELVEHMDQIVGSGRFDPGVEPYSLGVLACLVLRQEGSFDQAAPRLQAAALTPVEAAVEGVQASPQPEDTATLARARETVARQNQANRKEADQFLSSLNDPNNVRFQIPDDWSTGSTGYRGGMRLVELPTAPLLYSGMSADLEQPGTGTILTLEDCPAIEGRQLPGEQEPGGDHTEVVIPKWGLRVNADGTIDINTPAVRVTNLRAHLVEQNGMTRVVLDQPNRMLRAAPAKRGPRLIKGPGGDVRA